MECNKCYVDTSGDISSVYPGSQHCSKFSFIRYHGRIWFSCKYMLQSLGDFISRPNHTVVYGWKVWAGWWHIFMPNIVSVMVTILWQLSPGPIITSGRWSGLATLGTSRDYLLTTAIMRGHCPLPRPPTPFILNIIIWTVNILHWTMWRTATTTMSISDVVMLTMDHLIWTQDWPWFANLAFNKGKVYRQICRVVWHSTILVVMMC